MNASRDDWERPKYLDLLYELRAKCGKTWKQVDAEARVDKSTREQWFNGRTKDPPFTSVVRLADAIGVDIERLAAAVRGEEATAARASLDQRVATLEATVAQLREVQGSAEGREVYARWQGREDALRVLQQRGEVHDAEAQARRAAADERGSQQ